MCYRILFTVPGYTSIDEGAFPDGASWRRRKEGESPRVHSRGNTRAVVRLLGLRGPCGLYGGRGSMDGSICKYNNRQNEIRDLQVRNPSAVDFPQVFLVRNHRPTAEVAVITDNFCRHGVCFCLERPLRTRA